MAITFHVATSRPELEGLFSYAHTMGTPLVSVGIPKGHWLRSMKGVNHLTDPSCGSVISQVLESALLGVFLKVPHDLILLMGEEDLYNVTAAALILGRSRTYAEQHPPQISGSYLRRLALIDSYVHESRPSKTKAVSFTVVSPDLRLLFDLCQRQTVNEVHLFNKVEVVLKFLCTGQVPDYYEMLEAENHALSGQLTVQGSKSYNKPCREITLTGLLPGTDFFGSQPK